MDDTKINQITSEINAIRKEQGFVLISKVLLPLEESYTEYGFITNIQWCNEEADRINNEGGRAIAVEFTYADTGKEYCYLERSTSDAGIVLDDVV